jgi:hypothetical protein
LDGIQVSESGVKTDQLVEELGVDETLRGILNTLSSTVSFLGGEPTESGCPPKWTLRPKGLQLSASGAGYLFARWELEPSSDCAINRDSFEVQAIDTLLELTEQGDPAYRQTIEGNLQELADALPKGTLLWLGDAENPNGVGIAGVGDPDDGLELLESFSMELQTSLEVIARGGSTRSAEQVAQRQGLSW